MTLIVAILLIAQGGHPEWHIIQDVLALINGNCTFKTTDGETCDKSDIIVLTNLYSEKVGE